MQRVAETIDRITMGLGRAVAWCVLAMVVVMFWGVVQRYFFDINYIWQQELVRFFHAGVFLLAASYTLLKDAHVRVDVFYRGFTARRKAWVDAAGTVVFLWPVCVALLYFSADFVRSSWAITERSPEYGGMPGVFLLKTCIWGFALTLALQGVATLLRAVTVLRRG